MSTNAFWSRVDRTPTCWLWTGPVGPRGFGITSDPATRRSTGTLAHLVAWATAGNPAPPPGGALLHRCGDRRCVRPDHLELVAARPRQWRAGGRSWVR